MKNLHLNEKHLADKLQHVPVPDVDQSWEQMKELLERDMPRPVGGAWGGNRKWWWMGITVGLIMMSLWVSQELNQKGAQISEAQPAEVKRETSDVKGESVSETTPSSKSTQKNQNNQATEITQSTDVKQADNTTAQTIQSIDQPKSEATSYSSVPLASNSQPPTSNIQLPTSNKQNKPNKQIIQSNYTKQNIKKNTPAFLIASEEKTDIVLNSSEVAAPEYLEISQINTLEKDNNINTSNIQLPTSNIKGAIPGKTDRAFAKEVRQKSMKKDNRRMSGSSMRGNFGDDGREITFAAGLTLPQSVAISSQQSPSYNINANKTRVTDYLPAPFFQYHLNNKLFLQTEFHFQAPQYTDRLLLNSSASGDPAVMRVEKKEYLEKLYYFNIPLNLYYTPMRNVSVGGGLQYSSFLSGVASYEEKRTSPTASTYSSVARRFKDDSLASRFAPSEFRYQLDANYYFNRFTLGMRYTQAMKDFLTVAPVNNVGLTRNKSFLLYLRFNIWEERKKGGAYSAYNY